MKVLATVVVGSRLHGINNEDSDWDYRGIHISPLKDVLSPFKKQKNTSWLEGDEDNTSYELAEFCKLATKGNATILEVFFSNQTMETSPEIEEMRQNWKKFMDTHHFINASRGYAHNQWNKFYNFEDVGVSGQHRTAKFAIAFIRVMWQCEQFLLTGEFKSSLDDCDSRDLLIKIKPMSVQEIKTHVPEIVGVMGQMDTRVSYAMSISKFMDMKPDLEWIEEFIYKTYIKNKKEEK